MLTMIDQNLDDPDRISYDAMLTGDLTLLTRAIASGLVVPVREEIADRFDYCDESDEKVLDAITSALLAETEHGAMQEISEGMIARSITVDVDKDTLVTRTIYHLEPASLTYEERASLARLVEGERD